MSRRKKLLYYSLLAVLTLAALEGMARLAYFLAFDQWYRSDPPGAAAAIELAPRESFNIWWRSRHPFYGYTHAHPDGDLNLLPPHPLADDTVVIGVLGGSVAWHILPHFRRAVNQHFSTHQLPRRPVVVELALMGARQPAQAITAANTLALGGHFDLIVNLDGRNELTQGAENLALARAPFFPWAWADALDLTDQESRLVGRIGVLRAQEYKMQRNARSHPFRHTALYGLLNRYRLQRTTAAITRLNHELIRVQTAYKLELHGPRRNSRNAAAIFRESAQTWYRGSLLLAELAELAGAEYYHFQQPNQYVPDAKPLNAAELACCYVAGSLNEVAYRQGYPLLAQFGEKLRQQDINYFDLTGIFADHHETLYQNLCCHLNERGNELLAAAIVERLAPALRRASNRPAPPPDSGLAAAHPTPQPPQLLAAAQFQVYLHAGNQLLYVRPDCPPKAEQSRFFLHIVPVNPADLPPHRREHGFANRDFSFYGANAREAGFAAAAGGRLNGQCIVARRLPPWSIASLRTGQFNSAGELWSAEYHFPQ